MLDSSAAIRDNLFRGGLTSCSDGRGLYYGASLVSQSLLEPIILNELTHLVFGLSFELRSLLNTVPKLFQMMIPAVRPLSIRFCAAHTLCTSLHSRCFQPSEDGELQPRKP